MMHEAGHWIFHRKTFSRNTDDRLFLYDVQNNNIQCRTDNIEGKFKYPMKWDDKTTMEWQANYFAGAILMPKSMIMKLCNDEELKDYLDFMGFGSKEVYNMLLIKRVSEIFNVSKKAAEVRLSCLGIINNECSKYISFDKISF